MPRVLIGLRRAWAGRSESGAPRDAELERVNAELAVLRRLVFGRSTERARPEAAGSDGGGENPTR